MVTVLPVFEVPDKLAHIPDLAPPEQKLEQQNAFDLVARQNWMLGMVFVTGCVVSALLLADSRMRSSSLRPRSLILGLPFGVCLSAVVAAAATWLADMLRARLSQSVGIDALQRSVLVESALLAMTGAGIGASLWVLHRRSSHILQYGMSLAMAGVVAGFLYPLLAGLLILRADTDLLIPRDTEGQMLWIAIVSLSFGMTASSIHWRSQQNASESTR